MAHQSLNETTTSHTAANILIVEDDVVAATLLKKTLKDLGHKVVGVAVEGKRAIEMARETKPNLMMVDYQLEDDLSGADVTRQVLEEQSLAVIFVTSQSDQETLRIIADTNPNGYILKPFDRKEIGMIINTVLEKYNQQRILNSLNQELGLKVEMTTEELKASLEKLRIEVAMRKETELKLQDALRREQQLSDIKSHLASSISDELETPLTSILSSTQLLLMHQENKKDLIDHSKHLRKIEQAAIQLKKLLNDMKAMDNAGLRTTGQEESIVETAEFLKKIIEEVQNNIQAEVEFKLQFHNIPRTISTYASMLSEILQNLATNAANYSAERATVLVNVTGTRGALSFEFVDSGIGIPQKEQKNIMNYFYRASNVAEVPGSGLGLAIANKFATILNAELSFESKVDSGSVFRLELPLNQ